MILIKKWLSVGMVLVCGFVIGLNSATMHPNPSYEANWTNIIVALVFAAFFGGCSIIKVDKKKD